MTKRKSEERIKDLLENWIINVNKCNVDSGYIRWRLRGSADVITFKKWQLLDNTQLKRKKNTPIMIGDIIRL